MSEKSFFPGAESNSDFPPSPSIPVPGPIVDSTIPDKLYILAYKIIISPNIAENSQLKINATNYLNTLFEKASNVKPSDQSGGFM